MDLRLLLPGKFFQRSLLFVMPCGAKVTTGGADDPLRSPAGAGKDTAADSPRAGSRSLGSHYHAALAIAVPVWRVIATNFLRACVISMLALIICTGGHEEEVFDKIFGTVGEAQFKAADALIDNEKIHEEANGNSPEAVSLAIRLAPALAARRMPGSGF